MGQTSFPTGSLTPTGAEKRPKRVKGTSVMSQKEKTMELKEFVKATLEQIVEGAALAQQSIKNKGGIINPSNMSFQKDGAWNNYNHAMPQEVVFDVALTSTDKSGSTEGIGVFLGSISLGKKNELGVEQVAVTKVKFTVPLVLPPGEKLLREDNYRDDFA